MSYPSGPPQAVEQHCYRHADRRAGVSCQRCNRPICPSCMINASVGFQCPECAKQGAKQQRLVDVINRQNAPVLTYVLIGINVAIFLVGLAVGDLTGKFGTAARAAYLSDGRVVIGGVADGEWWRIITGGFLHANVLHLAMNMYVLYIIGSAIEGFMGRVRFGVAYMVALIGGSLGAIVVTPDGFTVGASGAIFGMFAVLACLQLSRGQNPMQGGIGPTIAINLAITLVFSSFISVGGHVGGLITGGLCGALLFGLNPRQAFALRDKQQLTIAGVGALGVVLFGAAIAAAYALA